MTEGDTRWRSEGLYFPTSASKAGLVPETHTALELYARLRDWPAVREVLVNAALPQRSRQTRRTIAEFIGRRLFGWHPPDWVLEDVIRSEESADPSDLLALLLLYACRQDTLLYDFVQCVIAPKWRSGELQTDRADVQRFLDESASAHPEIGRWTHATREKLSSNALSILRDYGLMWGTATKHIVEPAVSAAAAQHLIRALGEEGISDDAIASHPDWNLWLWNPERVRAAMSNRSQER